MPSRQRLFGAVGSTADKGERALCLGGNAGYARSLSAVVLGCAFKCGVSRSTQHFEEIALRGISIFHAFLAASLTILLCQ
jgi:hypothetical protein